MSRFDLMQRCFLMLMLTVFAFVPAVQSADKKSPQEMQIEKEAKDAAAEDAAENSAPESVRMNAIKTLEGRLVLLAPGESDNPAVVGTFTTPTASYLVKVADDNVLKAIQPYDKKSVPLQGRIRNEGKYFVVIGIVQKSAGGVIERHKRGGI